MATSSHESKNVPPETSEPAAVAVFEEKAARARRVAGRHSQRRSPDRHVSSAAIRLGRRVALSERRRAAERKKRRLQLRAEKEGAPRASGPPVPPTLSKALRDYFEDPEEALARVEEVCFERGIEEAATRLVFDPRAHGTPKPAPERRNSLIEELRRQPPSGIRKEKLSAEASGSGPGEPGQPEKLSGLLAAHIEEAFVLSASEKEELQSQNRQTRLSAFEASGDIFERGAEPVQEMNRVARGGGAGPPLLAQIIAAPDHFAGRREQRETALMEERGEDVRGGAFPLPESAEELKKDIGERIKLARLVAREARQEAVTRRHERAGEFARVFEAAREKLPQYGRMRRSARGEELARARKREKDLKEKIASGKTAVTLRQKLYSAVEEATKGRVARMRGSFPGGEEGAPGTEEKKALDEVEEIASREKLPEEQGREGRAFPPPSTREEAVGRFAVAMQAKRYTRLAREQARRFQSRFGESEPLPPELARKVQQAAAVSSEVESALPPMETAALDLRKRAWKGSSGRGEGGGERGASLLSRINVEASGLRRMCRELEEEGKGIRFEEAARIGETLGKNAERVLGRESGKGTAGLAPDEEEKQPRPRRGEAEKGQGREL